MVQCLLVYWADDHSPDLKCAVNTAICLAAMHGHLFPVAYLVEGGATDIDMGVFFAAKGGHLSLVKYLATYALLASDSTIKRKLLDNLGFTMAVANDTEVLLYLMAARTVVTDIGGRVESIQCHENDESS